VRIIKLESISIATTYVEKQTKIDRTYRA